MLLIERDVKSIMTTSQERLGIDVKKTKKWLSILQTLGMIIILTIR